MSGSGGGSSMRGAKPPRVDPNVRPAAAAAIAGAVLPTHVVVPADPADDATAPINRRPVVSTLLSIAIVPAVIGLLLFGVWMNPVVSIDGVSATGLRDAAGKNASTISPSFDVAVRFRRRWFRLLPDTYTNGTVAVSCAGGAVTARGELRDVTLTAISPSVVSATARAPPTALPPGGTRDPLSVELRRGEVHLDVSVSYDRSSVHEPYGPFSHGFRAMCAATALGRGNSTATATASCTVVRKASPNDFQVVPLTTSSGSRCGRYSDLVD